LIQLVSPFLVGGQGPISFLNNVDMDPCNPNSASNSAYKKIRKSVTAMSVSRQSKKGLKKTVLPYSINAKETRTKKDSSKRLQIQSQQVRYYYYYYNKTSETTTYCSFNELLIIARSSSNSLHDLVSFSIFLCLLFLFLFLHQIYNEKDLKLRLHNNTGKSGNNAQTECCQHACAESIKEGMHL